MVALELDSLRLNSLLADEKQKSPDFFIKILQLIQNYLGKKTGVMPGDEMVHAYNRSLENGIDVALIDQDIRITIKRLKEVRRKEKVKAFASIILSPLLSQKIDLAKIPDEEMINKMIQKIETRYPEMHNALIDERDQYMAQKLKKLEKERPDAKISAFVGAGHKKGIENHLEQ